MGGAAVLSPCTSARWHACGEDRDAYDSPQEHWIAALQGRVELIDTAGIDDAGMQERRDGCRGLHHLGEPAVHRELGRLEDGGHGDQQGRGLQRGGDLANRRQLAEGGEVADRHRGDHRTVPGHDPLPGAAGLGAHPQLTGLAPRRDLGAFRVDLRGEIAGRKAEGPQDGGVDHRLGFGFAVLDAARRAAAGADAAEVVVEVDAVHVDGQAHPAIANQRNPEFFLPHRGR